MELLAHVSQVVIGLLLVFAMGGGTALQLYKIFYGEPARIAGTWGAVVVLVCFGAYFGYHAIMAGVRLAFYLKLGEEQRKRNAS